MHKPVKKIMIVGGGSAGWLTAGVIAAEHVINKGDGDQGIQLVLIESPDVPTIGVGEGTWPSMRSTLKKIGVSETDFFRECDASFKQGSKFVDWIKPGSGAYYHPFSLPDGRNDLNLVDHWFVHRDKVSFADAVCPIRFISDRHLAPKLISTPEFAGNSNYGYHLDAGKFSNFLKTHCIEKLGVTYIQDHVIKINSAEDGDIASITTKMHGDLAADLFIDCTGFASLLLGEHYQIPLKEERRVLFNDSALAVQVPYPEADTPIESCTISTAQDCGWIWDIGLPTRRGVGHVFSSAHTSDEQVLENLKRYLEPAIGKSAAEKISPRKLTFNPGYREKLWHKNCVGVGIAAGFIEPLEATALVLIELSAQMIAEQLPATRGVMDTIAQRFNQAFHSHWQRVIEFLKLHYVLSERRDTDYWRDHLDDSTQPEGLRELLELWRYRSPWKQDIRSDEMFPWASYQYVLYGMGFETKPAHVKRSAREDDEKAMQLFNENMKKSQLFVDKLPSNRELLTKLREFRFQKV